MKVIWREDKYNHIFAFLLTALTMYLAMSYLGIAPGGKYYALIGDLYVQYGVFSPHLAEKIMEGSNFYYSFNVGMGINTALIWAFYCLSPLDVFYLLIENIELATIIILIGKASLAALFFQLFCRYNLGQNGKETILFSMGYGLCAYQMIVQQMSSLTDGLYFLPLVLILVKKLVEEGKVALLSLVYASLFLTNFYCGYIVGLASFGYLVTYLFLKKGDEKRKLILIFGRFMGAAVIGFAMASFVMVPAVLYVFGMESGGLEKFGKILGTPIQDYMCFFMGREYELETPFPYFYCGLFMLLIMPLYFVNKKISRKERWTVGGIVLFFCVALRIPFLYQLLHMFNEPNGYIARFAYVLVFLFLAVSVRQFPYLKEINFKKYGLYCVGLILLLVISVVLEGMLPLIYKLQFGGKEFLLNIIFIAIWYFLLYSYFKKETKDIMIAVLLFGALELGLSTYLILDESDYLEKEIVEYRNQQISLLTQEVMDTDSGIYRMDVEYEYNKNNPTYFGYYGIPYFSSAYNGQHRDTMGNLGYIASSFVLTDLGGTEVTDMLFGIKYYVTPGFLDGTVEAAVRRNPYALSLGYMVTPEMAEVVLPPGNPFDNQELLLEAMTGTYYDIYGKFTGNVDISGENVNIGLEEDPQLNYEPVLVATRLDPANEITYVKFTIPGDERRMFVMLSSGINMYKFTSHMVRTSQHNEPTNAHRSMLTVPHIVEMDWEEGDFYSVYITYPEGAEDSFVVKDMVFMHYNEEMLPVIWEDLAEGQMEIIQMEDGYIKGVVCATEDKPVLFLSIPYEEGWEVLVDGQETSVLPLVEESFLGVELTPGEHTVEFVFTAPGSKAGILISVVGAVAFLGLLFVEYYGFCKKKEKNANT